MITCGWGHLIDAASKQCKNTLCRGVVAVLILGLLTWTGANSSETVEQLQIVAHNQHGIKEGVLKLEQTVQVVGLRVAENTSKNEEQDERLDQLEKRVEDLEGQNKSDGGGQSSPQKAAQPKPQAVPLKT